MDSAKQIFYSWRSRSFKLNFKGVAMGKKKKGKDWDEPEIIDFASWSTNPLLAIT